MKYKIIIPQEELKPHSFCETPDEKCTMNYCDDNGCQNRKRELVEPILKQETLEEAAERLQKDKYGIFISKDADVKGQLVIDTAKSAFLSGMIEGAKFQFERMYSDIEVFTQELKDKIDSFEYSVNQNSYISDYIKEWFEQFSKLKNES
jgi:hypothetical protein